jgi:hypothetical protein
MNGELLRKKNYRKRNSKYRTTLMNGELLRKKNLWLFKNKINYVVISTLIIHYSTFIIN